MVGPPSGLLFGQVSGGHRPSGVALGAGNPVGRADVPEDRGDGRDIRTSGEECVSNVLLWESAYFGPYFCDAYWPAFREVDFLRARQAYAARRRRYGA